MPTPKVVPLPLKRSHAYLVTDGHEPPRRAILVDTGGPGEGEKVLELIEGAGLRPPQLSAIILTHGHRGHAGSAADLRERTGAKVLIHPADAHWLSRDVLWPLDRAGRVGRWLWGAWEWARRLPRVLHPGEYEEIAHGMELSRFGVGGKVIHTPGHTPGSVSVLLEGGEAIVGDLLRRRNPRWKRRDSRGEPEPEWVAALSGRSSDKAQAQRSVRRLIDQEPTRFYFSHDGSLPADQVASRMPGSSSPALLVKRELKEMGMQVPAEWKSPVESTWVESPPCELTGLALSGGGVRSATFNLGMLQSLEKLGLLHRLQYVSTVSGGGYIGGFWSALRKRRGAPGAPCFPTASRAGRESDEIRHLREFSNFLAPRLGIFSYDTGRLLVSALSSTVPALVTALSLLLLALVGWLLLADLLFRGARTGGLAEWGSDGAFVVLTAAILMVPEETWRRRNRGARWRDYSVAATAGVAATAACWLLLSTLPLASGYEPGQRLPMVAAGGVVPSWEYVLAPALAWAGGALLFILVRWFSSLSRREDVKRPWRTAFDRAHSRLLLGIGIWCACSLVWYVGVRLFGDAAAADPTSAGSWLAAVTAATAGLFTWVQKKIGNLGGGALTGTLKTRLRPLLPQLLAYLTIALLAVWMAVVVLLVDRGLSGETPDLPLVDAAALIGYLPWRDRFAAGLEAWERAWGVVAVALGAGAIVGLALFLLNPNKVGLHAFYRARLARAFLGASNPRAKGLTDEHELDDIPLRDLSPDAPLHLVCCAANDLSPIDGMVNLNRGAESAVLSRVGFSVAEEWQEWTEEGSVPTLAAAMTASGAAFNSLMGSKSRVLGPGVTFLMAAFNLRLGLWVPHPTGSREQALSDRKAVGLPFLKEMFWVARSRGSDVHLSDGGHFENMGLYELVRRHCRYVIASDCGMDSDRSFDDFGNAVRRIREDFGVEIEIDLSPLRPDENGLARQPMVAGDIHYPTGDTGILLLFKPTLVGTEPVDIAQYKRRNAAFPHESTGDQFYDEAQWESYRRLGEHAAASAFRFMDNLPLGGAGTIAQIFANARREWLPVPSGYEDRVSRISQRTSALDAALRQSDCARLLREVYKEIDELDAEAAARAKGEDAGAADRLSQAEISASLAVIRQAIHFMEEVYLSEELETRYNHSLYLGLMNYFARWAYAPLFRMWWPLVKSMYPQRFVRFLEQRFGLASVGEGGDVQELVEAAATPGDSKGFATACWEQEGKAKAPTQKVFSFHLSMRYRGHEPYRVQAARLSLSRLDGLAVWDVGSFFVPAGLWGIGIGERFLEELKNGECFRKDPPRHLLVRIAKTGRTDSAALKEIADEAQLYRNAGFAEPPLLPLEEGELLHALGLGAEPRPAAGCRQVRWLIRSLGDGSSRGAGAPTA